MHDSPSGLRWQPVSARDIPAIVALYAEALAVDGGQPYAGDEALLRRWYTGGIEVSLAASMTAGWSACARGGTPARGTGRGR